MDNKPISFEDKMKYRDNEFLYDKCIKQHDCIINYQWKMRDYKDRINRAIEYIENNQLYEDLTEYDDEINFSYVSDLKATKDLLSILRGEDNE